MSFRLRVLAVLLLITPLALAPAAEAVSVVDFEDVGGGLAPEGFLNDSFGFTSGGAGFNNTFSTSQFGDFWAGWSVSNQTDPSRPGGPTGDPALFLARQYTAQPGGGADPLTGNAVPGEAYGVGFVDSFTPFIPRITFASPTPVVGTHVTNVAYPFLSMSFGDAFAKQFGGATGDDPDFFELTITGLDASDQATGSVTVALADFRFADNAQDFILDTWEYVDLSGLGVVSALSFGLETSDVGPFGANTPFYFAVDNVVTPEPATSLLVALGLVALALGKRPGA